MAEAGGKLLSLTLTQRETGNPTPNPHVLLLLGERATHHCLVPPDTCSDKYLPPPPAQAGPMSKQH